MFNFKKPSYGSGLFIVFLAGIFWSTQGIAVRLMENADAWQILFYRSISVSLFTFAIIWVTSNGKPFGVFREAGVAGVIGGVCLFFGYAGGILAMQQTTIANAVFLFATSPFFAAVLGYYLLKENVKWQTWIAMVVALFGILIMIGGQLSFGDLLGNAYALGSSMGFAVFTITLRWKKINDMLPAVCLSGIFTTIIAAILAQSNPLGLGISMHDVWLSIGMGVGQTGLGLVLYTIGSRTVPAVELALLPLVEVILSPFWVWLILGERINVFTMWGGALLILAIAGNALFGLKSPQSPPPGTGKSSSWV